MKRKKHKINIIIDQQTPPNASLMNTIIVFVTGYGSLVEIIDELYEAYPEPTLEQTITNVYCYTHNCDSAVLIDIKAIFDTLNFHNRKRVNNLYNAALKYLPAYMR